LTLLLVLHNMYPIWAIMVQAPPFHVLLPPPAQRSLKYGEGSGHLQSSILSYVLSLSKGLS
jgi:hypothetical protein